MTSSSSASSSFPSSSSSPNEISIQWDILQREAYRVLSLYRKKEELPSNAANSSMTTTSPTEIIQIVSTMAQWLFGGDESHKQKAIGALEWIVLLLQCLPSSSSSSSSALEQPNNCFIIKGLKAIRTCVVRNPIGRDQCRSSGALNWIQSILEEWSDNSMVIEEGMTTLAAICINHDINALQVTMIFRKYIDAAEQKFPDQLNIQQKLMYLKALCSAIEKEQMELIIHLRDFENNGDVSSSSSSFLFWNHITQVERILFSLDERIRQSRDCRQTKLQPEEEEQQRDDNICLPSLVENNTESAHTILTPALTFLSFFMDDANWMKEFLWKLRWCRAMLILQKPTNQMSDKSNDDDVAITDMEFCETSHGGNQEKRLAELFFLRAKVLYASHDVEEAHKTLAKAILWDPSKHDDWSAHLGILQLENKV